MHNFQMSKKNEEMMDRNKRNGSQEKNLTFPSNFLLRTDHVLRGGLLDSGLLVSARVVARKEEL